MNKPHGGIPTLPDGRMNVSAAADYLGFTPKTLAQWRSRGEGPNYIRLGGRIFYHRAALDAWIERATVKTA
ncbi:helix-turn-helix transcriptional regulator [Cupriavidus campinensis]